MCTKPVRLVSAAALAVVLTACDGGQDDKAGGTKSPSAKSSPSHASAAQPLSKEWGPRLEATKSAADFSVCGDGTEPECLDAVEAVMSDISELSDDIDAAGPDAYSQTREFVEDMQNAEAKYLNAECGTGGDDIATCFDNAGMIRVRLSGIKLRMMLDEDLAD